MCIIRRAYGTIFRIGVAPQVAQCKPPPPRISQTRGSNMFAKMNTNTHRCLVFISSYEKQHVFTPLWSSQCCSFIFSWLRHTGCHTLANQKETSGLPLDNNMNKILIKSTTFNIKYLWGAPGWERVQTAPPDTAPLLAKGWPWGRRLAAESLWWSYCPWEEEKRHRKTDISARGVMLLSCRRPFLHMWGVEFHKLKKFPSQQCNTSGHLKPPAYLQQTKDGPKRLVMHLYWKHEKIFA